MRAIRERMVELDFKEEFIEKILKEYSMKKIDEKLDLLLNKKNIQNPPAWLISALKNDYQDAESSLSFPRPSLSFPRPSLSFPRKRESIKPAEEPIEKSGDKILSSEEAAKRFKLLRQKLMAMNSSRSKP